MKRSFPNLKKDCNIAIRNLHRLTLHSSKRHNRILITPRLKQSPKNFKPTESILELQRAYVRLCADLNPYNGLDIKLSTTDRCLTIKLES